ncbi:MAG TPA: tetratricopeptide repeat protein [Gemmatimonadaceae bacterium]
MFSAAPAAAQDAEFVRQTLLVTTFEADDRRLGREVADELRDAVDDLHDRDELDVVDGNEIRRALVNSSYDPDTVLTPGDRRILARKFRADEYVVGRAARAIGGVRIEARLVLFRDELRYVQPLPPAEGRDAKAAARRLAGSVREARKQATPLRLCENHARDFDYAAAVAAAQRGVAAYPRGTLVRTCVLNVLGNTGGRSDTVLKVAREVLAVDSTNPVALELAARTTTQLRGANEAAPLWERLAAAHATDTLLVQRAAAGLVLGGQASRALPIVERGLAQNPESRALLDLRFLVNLRLERWADAARDGEQLLALDPQRASSDPRFLERLATAYRSDQRPHKAIEIAARGIAAFPDDAELYVLYTQLVTAEAAVALPRGLERFPQSATLQAMNAQQFREQGLLTEALEATRLALEADPSLPRGFLQMAQLQIDLGQPDSALATLERALAAGDDSTTVAQYALGRGSALYKEANGTKSREDFERARRFVALADRAMPTAQSKFLLGAAAFSIGQSAATEAPAAKSCELAQLAGVSLTSAAANLEAGATVAPEAAQQYLAYIVQIRPYVDRQLEAFCDGAVAGNGAEGTEERKAPAEASPTSAPPRMPPGGAVGGSGSDGGRGASGSSGGGPTP